MSHWHLLATCEDFHCDPVHSIVFYSDEYGLENLREKKNSQQNVSDQSSFFIPSTKASDLSVQTLPQSLSRRLRGPGSQYEVAQTALPKGSNV